MGETFSKPEFIEDTEFKSLEQGEYTLVKSFSIIKEKQEGKTVEHKYFAKQNPEGYMELAGNFPEIYQKPGVEEVQYAIQSLEQSGHAPVTPAKVAALFRSNPKFLPENLYLRPEETLEQKIDSVFALMHPVAIGRFHEKRYEKYKEWFGEIVIPKHFVVGRGEDGAVHSYTLKQEVRSVISEGEIGAFLSFARAVGNEKQKPSYYNYFSNAIRAVLKTREARTRLANDFRKFAEVSRRVMNSEKIAVDPGGGSVSNLFITQRGELRLIDTDRVFSLQGSKDPIKNSLENILEALEYVADKLEKD